MVALCESVLGTSVLEMAAGVGKLIPSSNNVICAMDCRTILDNLETSVTTDCVECNTYCACRFSKLIYLKVEVVANVPIHTRRTWLPPPALPQSGGLILLRSFIMWKRSIILPDRIKPARSHDPSCPGSRHLDKLWTGRSRAVGIWGSTAALTLL